MVSDIGIISFQKHIISKIVEKTQKNCFYSSFLKFKTKKATKFYFSFNFFFLRIFFPPKVLDLTEARAESMPS